MIAAFLRGLIALAVAWLALAPAHANPPGAVRFDPTQSLIAAQGRERDAARPLSLRLSVGVRAPWRVYLLDAPPRLVVEVEGMTLPSEDAAVPGAELLPGLRWGGGLSGWGRIVAELPGTYQISRATITGAAAVVSGGAQAQAGNSANTGEAGNAAGPSGDPARPLGAAAIELALTPVPADRFAPRQDALTALHGMPPLAKLPPAPPRHERLRVVIDPGHGGIDPGAQVDGLTEAALMLGFATELASALTAAGFEPMLTRGDDRFIPLEQRATSARAVRADLFISLHADMLPKGQAAGATIYVWNPQSNDRAARELAARHDRDDLLAGVDLDGTDDQVARALMDLARTGTQPRSEAFAAHLSSELALSDIGMHRRPVQGAAFSVLKSPDIPSALVELGFLSDPADRANLLNPAWRAQMAAAITRAVANWQADIASLASLRGAVPYVPD